MTCQSSLRSFVIEETSVHKTENANDSSEDLESLVWLYDNRLQSIVFRLQADVSVFFIKSLYSGRIIYQRKYFLTVFRSGLLFDDTIVAVANAGRDGGGPVHHQPAG